METRRALTLLAALTCASLVATLMLAPRAIGRTQTGSIKTRDGVKIHYLEAGAEHPKVLPTVLTPPTLPDPNYKGTIVQPSILFIPGWTMPGWIWQKQIDHFSRTYHVVAMDPRCQGESSQTADGLSPAARATALIVGAKSPYDFIVAAVQKEIPGSRLEIFEDAGHALFVDDADRFNSLLDNFLADRK